MTRPRCRCWSPRPCSRPGSPPSRWVTVPLPDLSPAAGKPIIARIDGVSLSSDCSLLALREVTDLLRFRMLMTTADCENANFCAVKGLELPMTPSSSLILVSDLLR